MHSTSRRSGAPAITAAWRSRSRSAHPRRGGRTPTTCAGTPTACGSRSERLAAGAPGTAAGLDRGQSGRAWHTPTMRWVVIVGTVVALAVLAGCADGFAPPDDASTSETVLAPESTSGLQAGSSRPGLDDHAGASAGAPRPARVLGVPHPRRAARGRADAPDEGRTRAHATPRRPHLSRRSHRRRSLPASADADGDRDPSADADGDRDPSADADGDRDPSADADGDRDPSADADGDRDPSADADGDRDPSADADRDRDPSADGDADANGDARAYASADANGDARASGDRDSADDERRSGHCRGRDG